MLHEYRVVESRHFGMVTELQAKNIPKAFHMLVGSVLGADGPKFQARFKRMTSHANEMTTQNMTAHLFFGC